MDPITNVSPVSGLNAGGGTQSGNATGQGVDSFSKILGAAIQNLNQVEAGANQAVAQLSSGEDVDLHQVMIAMQEADIAFQMALQVRNKLVEAYQEVMRMQV